MITIPKPLADVLALLGWEEITTEADAPLFRAWCSPGLEARLFVYRGRVTPCLLVWFDDEASSSRREQGDFDFAIDWFTLRTVYFDAMRCRGMIV